MSDFISDDEEAYGRGSESLETYDAADFMCDEGDELSEDISDEASESDIDIMAYGLGSKSLAYFPYTAERKKQVVFIDDYLYY